MKSTYKTFFVFIIGLLLIITLSYKIYSRFSTNKNNQKELNTSQQKDNYSNSNIDKHYIGKTIENDFSWITHLFLFDDGTYFKRTTGTMEFNELGTYTISNNIITFHKYFDNMSNGVTFSINYPKSDYNIKEDGLYNVNDKDIKYDISTEEEYNIKLFDELYKLLKNNKVCVASTVETDEIYIDGYCDK